MRIACDLRKAFLYHMAKRLKVKVRGVTQVGVRPVSRRLAVPFVWLGLVRLPGLG